MRPPRRDARTGRRLLPAAAALVVLGACVPLPINGAINDFVTGLGSRSPGIPAISMVMNAAGGDAVDVFLENDITRRRRLAEVVAGWLDIGSPLIQENDFLSEATTVRSVANDHLPRREGDAWVLAFDTESLQQAMTDEGFGAFDLYVCHPPVETRFRESRPSDYGTGDLPCLFGGGWRVDVAAEPLRVSLRMLPDAGEYLRFVAGVALGTLLLGTLAWFVGDRLRDRVFRRRSPASVVLGLVAGGLTAIGISSVVGTVAATFGPAANLTLAHGYGVPTYAAAIVFPALAAAIPGLLFAAMLVRRRPWAEDPLDEPRPAWPPPPPAPGSGVTAEPPPPLPWRNSAR